MRFKPPERIQRLLKALIEKRQRPLADVDGNAVVGACDGAADGTDRIGVAAEN